MSGALPASTRDGDAALELLVADVLDGDAGGVFEGLHRLGET